MTRHPSTVEGGGGPPVPEPPAAPDLGRPRPATIAAVAAAAGLRRVHMLAWRDLDDPEAGGSELHAARVAGRWAEAGLEVTMRTSFAAGHPIEVDRDGYRVVRRAGRYLVFPRAAFSEALRREGRWDGLVEIWNGMPFFSPIWARGPRVVFLHHVHGAMWRMVLAPGRARLGELTERYLAPPFYRRTQVVTLSESSRHDIVEALRLRPDRVSVVPPGVDPQFTPGGSRATAPLVAAVGRLVPVKHFDLLIEVLARLRRNHPELQAVIAGEGYELEGLRARVAELGAGEWIDLPGRVPPDALVDLYRRAWVVASASSHEGWGMTLTEAAACATPAVATKIPGHADALVDGVTGLLAGGPDELRQALDRVLSDGALRLRLGTAARRRAQELTWDATAQGTLSALAAARSETQPRGPRRP